MTTAAENSVQLTQLSSARVRRPSRTRKVARIALGALGLVAIAAASGAAYEMFASTGDAAAYPPAGRLVDWLAVPDGALVKPKDTLESHRKRRFHQSVKSVGDYGFDGA